MSQASELRDIILIQEAHEKRLDAHDKRLDEQERLIIALDRAQQTYENQIEIFRTGINESCQRAVRQAREEFAKLKEELLRARD